MKITSIKLFFFVILLTISTSSMADWEYLETSADNSATFYYEPTSIKKQKNIITLFQLTDFRQLQSQGNYNFYSIIRQTKTDCKKNMSTTSYVVIYSGHLGEGNVLMSKSNKQAEWSLIIPQTLAETVQKLVCK